jgi:thiol:disulfide interchange protein DsbD
MPCVLPVLTFKLHPSQSRKNKIFYIFGSMTTFIILSLFSIFLTSFSWGFQMQSPLFLFFFATILFFLLIDIYSEKNFFQSFSSTSYFFDKLSFLKDFFEGVLSTILSTPCTGPFLTTALSLSLQLPAFEIFFLFFTIGLGFNFPMLLFLLFPNSFFLPKSGPWMEHLKDFLNAILVFVFLWIIYLNVIQIKSLWFFLYFGFLFFIGILKNKFLRIFFLLFSFFSFYQIFYAKKENIQVFLNPYNVPKNVVMNFTAQWCLTCQVYKRTLLKSSFFLDFLKKKNLQLIEISLDENNPEAQHFLKEHLVEGIPAYFINNNGKNVYIGSWFNEQILNTISSSVY